MMRLTGAFHGLAWAILLLGTVPAEAQERIVSIGGDVTEIIYALGYGDRVVGTDSTSVFPNAANETPKVGYIRRLAAEGILSLEPDIIFVSGAAGPPETLNQLRDSQVRVIKMEEVYTLASIRDKTRRVANALGGEEAGADLLAKIDMNWKEAQAEIAAFPGTPRIVFFAALADGSPRAAGTETAADAVIRLIGGKNVFDTHEGYKALSYEAAVAADPEYILVMDHHAERVGGVDAVAAHPALALTSAGRAKRVLAVDQVTVMQFGPRTPAALARLARALREQSES